MRELNVLKGNEVLQTVKGKWINVIKIKIFFSLKKSIKKMEREDPES